MCIIHSWTNEAWNLWYLFHGTAMFPCWLKLMGSEVDGKVWYFGNSLHDFEKLHFIGRVIVDDSHLAGHFVVQGNLTIDDTYVRGLVHPGGYAYGGASISDAEHSPYTVFHATGPKKGNDESTSTDRLSSAGDVEPAGATSTEIWV